ncbi:MAG: hypothetical protein GF347_01640 [Candidatus Moranbacteria bacterium]|nr:hypothetical protein [Candidatus Moranbacteria bacterium]
MNLKKSFGLQIEDNCIRAVQLKKNRDKVRICGFCKRKLARGLIKDGVIEKQKELAKKLIQMLETARPEMIKNRKLVCSIPQNQVFIKKSIFPILPEEELNQAILHKLKEEINYSSDQIYFDKKILKKRNGQTEVLIVGTPREVIDSRLKLFEYAGLTPLGFEPNSFSIARNYFGFSKDKVKQKKENLKFEIIINIGSLYSTVFLKQGVLVLESTTFSFGLTFLIDKIIQKSRKNLKKSQALSKMTKIGFDFNKKSGAENKKQFEDELDQLNEHIEEFIKKAKAKFNFDDQKIDIFLTGAGARIKALDTVISMGIDRVVKEEKELNNVNLVHNTLTLPKRQIKQYSTVIGAALAGFLKNDFVFNLIPEKQRRKNLFNSNQFLIFNLAVVLVFLNLLLLGYFIYANVILKNKLTQINSNLSQIRDEPINKEIEFMEKEIEENQELLTRLYTQIRKKENEIPWTAVLDELSIYIDAGLKIKKIESDDQDPKKIKISGKAISREKLLELQSDLETSELFYEMDFPLENLVSNQNIDFVFEIKVNDLDLKD